MSRFVDWEADRIATSYREMAAWPSSKLEEVAQNPQYRTPEHEVTLAIATMELVYRTFGPHPEANSLVWQVIFGNERRVPIGLQTPSEAWPKLARRRMEKGIQ